MDSSAIESKHVIIGVLFELFLHLGDWGEGSVVDELGLCLTVGADGGVTICSSHFKYYYLDIKSVTYKL